MSDDKDKPTNQPAASTGQPKRNAENASRFTSLAELAQKRVEARRTVELWATGGFWLSVAAVTYFGIQIPEGQRRPHIIWAGGFYALMFLGYAVMVFKIQISNWSDGQFFHYFRSHAEWNLEAEGSKPEGHPARISTFKDACGAAKKQEWWIFAHVFPALVLALASWVLVFCTSVHLDQDGNNDQKMRPAEAPAKQPEAPKPIQLPESAPKQGN